MSSGKSKCLKLQRQKDNLQSCTAVKCAISGRVAPVTGVLTFPPRRRYSGAAQRPTSTRRPRMPKKVAARLPSSCPSPSAVSIGARDAARAARARNSDDFALLVAVASLDDAVPPISFPLVLPLRPAGHRPPRSTRSGAVAPGSLASGIEPVRGETAQPVRAQPTSPARRATSESLRIHSDVELTGVPVLLGVPELALAVESWYR